MLCPAALRHPPVVSATRLGLCVVGQGRLVEWVCKRYSGQYANPLVLQEPSTISVASETPLPGSVTWHKPFRWPKEMRAI
jgi:hypothetical protein